eukprot:Nk52_evm19s2209 gene=Nk52_evmTU19s2209
MAIQCSLRNSFLQSLKRLKLNNGPRRVAVALSGGADSMALTHLLSLHFEEVLAFTVDHKVRPESGEEALEVGKRANQIGVKHKILPIEWEDASFGRVVSKNQEMYRKIRYSLMIKECKRLGVSELFVGHHLDDRIETSVMRWSQCSGIYGIGSFKESSIVEDIWGGYGSINLIRPFFGICKEEIYAYCRDKGIPWFEDPTNSMEIYGRNMLRKGLEELFTSQENFSKDDLFDLVSFSETLSKSMDAEYLSFFQKYVAVNVNLGYLNFAAKPFVDSKGHCGKHILSKLTELIGGHSGVSAKAHDRAFDDIRAGRKGTVLVKRCAVSIHPVTGITITRQPIPNNENFGIPLQDKTPLVFDKRLAIELERTNERHSCRTFGVRYFMKKDYSFLKSLSESFPNHAVPKLPKFALQALPVIVEMPTDEVIYIPNITPNEYRSPIRASVELLNYHRMHGKDSCCRTHDK